ncbi:MAG: hypothetical protein OEV42_12640 [Deltaproteobacteria bacterium]|nr:hypothetical protein [Deltaproteobacteria bacterium]
MSRKPTTGGYISAYCTRCCLDLGHTIMVMKGDKALRVKCRTCGSEHIYRDKTKKSPPAKRTGPRTKAKKTGPSKNPERTWESAIEKAAGPDIPYSPGKSFAVGDILVHEKFGRGVVQTALPKKITILFKDKARLLLSSN